MKISILKNEELKEKIQKNLSLVSQIDGTGVNTQKPFFTLKTQKGEYIVKGNEKFSNQTEKSVGNYVSLSRYASNKAVKELTNSKLGNAGLININTNQEPEYVFIESKVKNFKSLKEISIKRNKELHGEGLSGINLFLKEMRNQINKGNISSQDYRDMVSVIGFNLLIGNNDFRTDNLGFSCDEKGRITGPVIIDQEPKYAMGQSHDLYRNNKPCNLTIEDIAKSELIGLAEVFYNSPELWDKSVEMYESYVGTLEELYNLDSSISYNIKKDLSPKRISDNIEISYDLDQITEGNAWIENYLSNSNSNKNKNKP